MTFSTRHRLLGLLLTLNGTAACATPAAGSWSEHARVAAGGLVIQQVEAQACYADGQSSSAVHAERIARRLIDPSCSSEPGTTMDTSRYAIRCGGSAFGDGVATLSETDNHTMRIDISFHNHATGVDMEYLVDTSWTQPQCSPH